MLSNLPEIAILKICNYLKLPDIINILKYDNNLKTHIYKFKKKMVYCDHDNEINYIFFFDFPYLLKNYIKLICELNYIRNNFFIDYTFCSDSYMSYISYIDSRGWLILEYFIKWFQSKNFYELPDFAETEIQMESFENHKYDKSIIEYNIDLPEKIKKYISCNKKFKNIIIKNSDFSELKNINF